MCRFFPPTENQLKLLDMVRDPEVLPPRSLEPDVPQAVEDVVLAVLAKDRDARPTTALELGRMLNAASPEARTVDAAQLADMVGLVMGPRLEERGKGMPASMNAANPPLATEELERAEGVFRALTVSAPNAAFVGETSQPESPPMTASSPPSTPTPSAVPVLPAPAPSRRGVWIGAGALLGVAMATSAVWIAVGALNQAPAPAIENTARPPAIEAPAPADPPVELVPAPPPVVVQAPAPPPIEPAAAAVATPVATEEETPARVRRRPQKRAGGTRMVDGVPIVGF